MNSNDTTKLETETKVQDLTHQVQCSCELDRKSFFERRYLQLMPRYSCNSCWKAQGWLSHRPPPRNSRDIFENLCTSIIETKEFNESIRQIELDLHRTYPDESYFSDTSSGYFALRNVLIAFSKYDSNLGYIQGMNFIAGALLWHASEVDAFWLFVALMEDYELRDSYLPSLPGLSKHCQIIQLLILEFLPRLHRQFAEHRIKVEMYAAEWCFTLFGSVVPVREMINVLDGFFNEGWIFFYRMVILLLQCLEKKLLTPTDPIEILMPLKICHKSQKEWKQFLMLINKGDKKFDWKSLISKVSEIDLDKDYIKYLHMSFNLDTAQFELKNNK
jgi:Rab-GTPase-TBC domain